MHISNRQQFVKRALKIITFVLLAVLLLEGMSKVLMPRSNSGSGGMHNYRARGFYGEEKNSLDIAAIGNSDLASGFSPMELWKSHGITGFACGEPNQTIDQSGDGGFSTTGFATKQDAFSISNGQGNIF